MIAATTASLHTVLDCVNRHNDLRAEDSFSRTPLNYVASQGNLENMKLLIDRKVPLNDESLHVAARLLHVPALQLLLDSSADIDWPGTTSYEGRTALGSCAAMLIQILILLTSSSH